jgi:hypothetical protein
MDAAIVKRVLDRLQGELEQIWADGYKAGVDATLHAMGKSPSDGVGPSIAGSEARPMPIDDD